MSVYWLIVAAIIVLGLIMPQVGQQRKTYVVVMAVLHTFVCGFRYMHLTGDLMKYNFEYLNMSNYGWFSDNVFHEGRNAGFYWLMKFVSGLTSGDFQIFLIVLAVITQVIVAVLIYRYSPKPWLSYLAWDCMGFFVFYDFSAIKQGLAMSVLMCAMICIFEKKPVGFLILTLLAGFIHMPALIFLPAYFIANRKISSYSIVAYIVLAAVIFVFRNRIVSLVSDVYYENETFSASDGIGGRFIVIILILLCGIVLKGFREKQFELLFNIIVIAAVLQMFSSFDNVFTRFADYYLQFSVLFIPMIFYSCEDHPQIQSDANGALLSVDEKSINIIVMVLVVVLIWWYNKTCVGVEITNVADDYTNFRFMWDVSS